MKDRFAVCNFKSRSFLKIAETVSAWDVQTLEVSKAMKGLTDQSVLVHCISSLHRTGGVFASIRN
jgi:hypothetical protein